MLTATWSTTRSRVATLCALCALAITAVMVTTNVGQSEDARTSLVASVASEILSDPHSTDVVATVNGRAILKRQVVATMLFANLPGATGERTFEAALQQQIGQEILKQGAERAGVVVEESEVDAMVQESLRPYREGRLSPEEEAMLDALFRAQGLSLAGAESSDEYRAALRGTLMVGRFLEQSGLDRTGAIAQLSDGASIEEFAVR